ncbi:MAG: transcriptional repressor [Acidobacteria bacterium]|nr:transcriptional repressor [Acidobacteriota bacterium]
MSSGRNRSSLEHGGGVLRESRQRRMILEVVAKSGDHPTAHGVYEHARRRMPSLSLGTVYRNLRLLVNQGFLKESKFGNRPARFEPNKQPHYHVCCLQCGRVEDLRLPYQGSLDRRVEQMVRYRLQEHRMEFYGVCPQCQPRRREANRSARR